jgi:hypothetical protein
LERSRLGPIPDNCSAAFGLGNGIDSRPLNRARTVTLLALVVVVVAFVATWLTIPGGRYEQKDLTRGYWETNRIVFPAKLFRVGLVERVVESCKNPPGDPFSCLRYSEIVYHRVDLHTLRQRVEVVYGGLAVAIVLVGLALGGARRSEPARRPS